MSSTWYCMCTQVYLGMLSGTTYAVKHPTTFTIGSIPGSTDNTRALIIADTDGDGWADCIVGNSGEQNRIYYGDGSGGFKGVGAIGSTTKQTLGMVAGDLNNDGNLDAVGGNFASGTEVTLGVSVPVAFDLNAIAAQQLLIKNLSFAGADSGGNPQPTMTDLDIVVGQPSWGPTNFDGTPNSQCRNPSDPYIPVTVRFRIEFPLVICYTPECIILNPLEGLGKAVGRLPSPHQRTCLWRTALETIRCSQRAFQSRFLLAIPINWPCAPSHNMNLPHALSHHTCRRY